MSGSTPINGGTPFLSTTTTTTTSNTPEGVRKLRQLSSSSSFSAVTSDEDETEDDRPEWYLKDTSVQFHRSPAEQDPAVGFFYTPRTLTMLSAMLLLLVYVAMTPEVDDTVTNVKLLLFKYMDPALGVPLPEKSYGDACELTYDNIVDQTLDVFVLAHALGWFCKALILRDYTFCWILSVMFEVMEYSLSHQLNNFDECWWDHWILDVLVCNWLGIYLGVKTCEYFEMKQYSWQGLAEIPTLKGKMKRTMQQFTPKSWTKFEWDSTKSFKSYATVIFILTMTLLWLPPAHPINIARIFSYFMFGIPGVREAYQYLHDPFGPQAWLLIGCIATEALIVVKFGRGEFPNPAPTNVLYFWAGFLTLLTVYPIYQFWLLPKLQERRIRKKLE
ncbi:hypothetical protein KI688_010453 [Linnemannia hyalina]|uniref:Phosphatidylserine synthase n=1 Tax=Linnemannia hyalina TaxID=64524 RepID=A0A9P8BV84_9FUNG|nr:hypothetical protein KI688_010453 [Linnemannia hyalina]